MKAVSLLFLLLAPCVVLSQGRAEDSLLARSKSYLADRKFKEAVLYADSAKKEVLRTKKLSNLEALYNWLSVVHFANKQYELALADLQIASTYKDSTAEERFRLAEVDWSSKLEAEKSARREDLLKQVEEIKRMGDLAQRNERNAIIIFASVLALLTIGIIALNRKRIQTKLAYEQAKARLLQLQSFKGKLFTVLSYDLAKSLSAFENLTHSLSGQMDRFSKEESIQLLKQLHITAGEFKANISNVIHWIAHQANAKPFQPAFFDIKVTAERELAKFLWQLKDKQLVSQVFIPENQIVFADQEMVEVVLNNLIANAVHFTHTGGTITCFSGKKDGLIMVGIKDTGVGISEENCKKLFESGTDSHTVGAPSHKGAGVGLILAKDLVERNRGRLYVESTLGQGSTFYFTLPEKKIDG